MKKSICLLFFLCIVFCSFGQKEYNVWYFGVYSGLTFNTRPPSSLGLCKVGYYEAGSGICDKYGNVLFYTNGDTVFNRENNVMKGGAPTVYRFISSTQQGTMVVPVHNKPGLYFMFSSSCWEDLPVNKGNLFYSIIDITRDNGLGEVIVRDNFLLKGIRGVDNPMGVALHANGKDYWVATLSGDISSGSSIFSCVRTVDDTVDAVPVNTPVGAYSGRIMKFSPDSKIVYVPAFSPSGNLSLFRFDNATGQITNEIKVRGCELIEFSHDSRFLYLGFDNSIHQYDLTYWNQDSVLNSHKILVPMGFERNRVITHFQLGPDKKIYIFSESGAVSVIHRPFLPGDLAKFEDNVYRFTFNGISRPYYPGFWFRGLKLNLGPDTILCEGSKIVLNPDAPPEATMLWSTEETTQTIQVSKPGKYWVRAILGKDTAYDTIEVLLQGAPPISQKLDTVTCNYVTLSIPPQAGGVSYVWSTGDTSRSINVPEKGKYSITVHYKYCDLVAETNVKLLPKPDNILGPDTSLCGLRDLNLRAADGNSFVWSTGETTPSITINKEGSYSVMVSRNNCTNTDSIYVGPQCYLECYIPNAFTPNGDGINNTFAPYCLEMKSYEMTIYDRWGHVLLNCENCAWDGTYDDVQVMPGAYMYQIQIIARSKRKETISGIINVLR